MLTYKVLQKTVYAYITRVTADSVYLHCRCYERQRILKVKVSEKIVYACIIINCRRQCMLTLHVSQQKCILTLQVSQKTVHT